MAESDSAQWRMITVGDTSIEMLVSEEVDTDNDRLLWPSVGEYPIYDEFCYQLMLQDELRNNLFRDAIVDCVADQAVLEIGTGPDMLWSSLAAESGAARIVAIEVLQDSARVARERAQELGPHVSVVEGESMEVTLEEKADLCIAEIVGTLGGCEGIATVIDDARARHLGPNPQVIPHRVRTPIAAVGVRQWLGHAPLFDPSAALYTERVMRSVDSVFDLRIGVRQLSESDLLTTTSLLEDLNLSAGEHGYPDEIQLEVTRAGEIDSCIVWLDLQCAPDHSSLDTLRSVTSWTPVLVPFHNEEPIPVEPGDVLALNVTKRLYDEIHPEWSFTGEMRHVNGSSTPVRADSPYAGGGFGNSWLHRALFREASQATESE